MQVILLKEVQGRGGEGDVIDVKPGFANNYLLRQGFAVKATPGNLKQLEQRKKNIAKREEVRVSDANALAEKLGSSTVHVEAQVGEEGQLFGSITAPMIADAIKKELDIDVDRRRIELGKPIKQTGEHKVIISIYRDIKAEITVVVKGVSPDGEVMMPEAAEAVTEVEGANEEAAEVVGEETIVASDGALVEVEEVEAVEPEAAEPEPEA